MGVEPWGTLFGFRLGRFGFTLGNHHPGTLKNRSWTQEMTSARTQNKGALTCLETNVTEGWDGSVWTIFWLVDLFFAIKKRRLLNVPLSGSIRSGQTWAKNKSYLTSRVRIVIPKYGKFEVLLHHVEECWRWFDSILFSYSRISENLSSAIIQQMVFFLVGIVNQAAKWWGKIWDHSPWESPCFKASTHFMVDSSQDVCKHSHAFTFNKLVKLQRISTHLGILTNPLKNPTNMGPKVKHLQTPWLHQVQPDLITWCLTSHSLLLRQATGVVVQKKSLEAYSCCFNTQADGDTFFSMNKSLLPPKKNDTTKYKYIFWSQDKLHMKQKSSNLHECNECISSIWRWLLQALGLQKAVLGSKKLPVR